MVAVASDQATTTAATVPTATAQIVATSIRRIAPGSLVIDFGSIILAIQKHIVKFEVPRVWKMCPSNPVRFHLLRKAEDQLREG